MEPTEESYAYIEDVTEKECFEKWEGNDWTANDDNSDLGVCESNFDFDGWAEEHEGDDSNASNS